MGRQQRGQEGAGDGRKRLAQWLSGWRYPPSWLLTRLQDPRGGRKEAASKSCPLTPSTPARDFLCPVCVHAHRGKNKCNF